MSAKTIGTEWWVVEFAYPGEMRVHWREVLVIDDTEREAKRQAEQLFCRSEETAVDMFVVRLDERGRDV